MDARPTMIVAGLGRCGTSMVMRMLAAAGVPTVGEAPDWEDGDAQRMLEDRPDDWARLVQGRAVKVLDAHRLSRMPDMPKYDLIWLTRDPVQQARSMVKLLGSVFATVVPDRGTIRAMSRSIQKDEPRAFRTLSGGARVQLHLRFEQILADPFGVANLVCAAFGIDRAHAPAMGSMVIRRSPACLPYLMETLTI
jgi:hypothetical protein